MENKYYKLKDAVKAADQILEGAILVDNSGTEWDCDNLLDAIKQEERDQGEFNDESKDAYWCVGFDGGIGHTKNNGVSVDWVYKVKK